jgi:hypothetical protein
MAILGDMGHLSNRLLPLLLACSPLLAQVNPDEHLRQAFVFEQQGQFAKVIAMTKPLTESSQGSRMCGNIHSEPSTASTLSLRTARASARACPFFWSANRGSDREGTKARAATNLVGVEKLYSPSVVWG